MSNVAIANALRIARKYANGGAVNTNPSPAQKEAGNYKKKHIVFHGIPITIENPKGTIRSGLDHKGQPWSSRMTEDYGYIKRTEGHDGDQVDCFVGPNKRSNRVWVVDQLHHSAHRFDEHKCLLGFNTEKQAIGAYRKSYGTVYDIHHAMGAVTEMSVDAFKEWLKGGGGKKPISPDVPQYRDGGSVDIEDVMAKAQEREKEKLRQQYIHGREINPNMFLAARGYDPHGDQPLERGLGSDIGIQVTNDQDDRASYQDGGVVFDPDYLKSKPEKTPNIRVTEGHQEFEKGYAPSGRSPWNTDYPYRPILNMRGQELHALKIQTGGAVNDDQGESWEPPPEPLEAGYPEPPPAPPPQPDARQAVAALSQQARGVAPPPPLPSGQQSLTAYQPTFEERLAGWLEGEHPTEYRKRLVREGLAAAEWTPGIGQALVGQAAIQHGQPQEAALAILPGAKALGPAAKGLNAALGKTLFELDPQLVQSAKPVSAPMGTGGGRFFELPDGTTQFIKPVKSLAHAKNEALTSAFYRELGIPSADAFITQYKGKPAIASKKIEGQELGEVEHPYNYYDHLQEHFAADAWLANWDSIGTGKNNIIVDKNGMAHRIDFGGGLEMRAMGAPKGDAFGNKVTELKTMKNPAYDAGQVFGDVPLHPSDPTANKIANFGDDKIRDLVNVYGPDGDAAKEKLANKLIARRDDLAQQYGITTAKPSAPITSATAGRSTFDMSPDLVKKGTKISNTFGINEGGLYQLQDGTRWYIKNPEGGLKQAKAEALAYQLAKLSGVPVPEIRLTQLNGKAAIASKAVEGQQISKIHPDQYGNIKGLQETFPFHAWINNRDAVGAGTQNPYGNIIVDKNWNPTFIDLGGSFDLGGLGQKKSFGHSIDELSTMLNVKMNPSMADVFGGAAKLDPNNPVANKIANISHSQLKDLVDTYGPSSASERAQLLGKLVNRRDDLAKRYGIFTKGFHPQDEAALTQVAKEQAPPSEEMPIAYTLSDPAEDAKSLMENHRFGKTHEYDKEGIARDLYRMAVEGYPDHADQVFAKLPPEIGDPVHVNLGQMTQRWGDPWTDETIQKTYQAYKESKQAGAPRTPPQAVAQKLLKLHGNDAGGIAEELYNLASAFSPKYADDIVKHLPQDLHGDIDHNLDIITGVAHHDPWNSAKSPVTDKVITDMTAKTGIKPTADEVKDVVNAAKAAKAPAPLPDDAPEIVKKAYAEALKDVPKLMNINKTHSISQVIAALKDIKFGGPITKDPKKVTPKQLDKIQNILNVQADEKIIAQSMFGLSESERKNIYSWLTPNKKNDVEAHVHQMYMDALEGAVPTIDVDVAQAQAEYEAKVEAQVGHEANIAAGGMGWGQAPGAPQTTSSGLWKFQPYQWDDEDITQVPFHFQAALKKPMTPDQWLAYRPKMASEKIKPVYLPNVTREFAQSHGFNVDFPLIKAGQKWPKDQPLKDPLTSKKYERAWFAGDIPLPYGYAKEQYVAAPKKVFEVNWPEVAHGGSHETKQSVHWNERDMHYLIEAGHQAGADMLIIHHMSDMGSSNHTQYAVLNPAILRSPEAKFDPTKFHLRFPFFGLVGGGLLTYGMMEGQGEAAERPKYAAGGAVNSKKINRSAFLYMDPKPPKDSFAQCGTCLMFTGTGCTILGKTPITKDMTCGLYVRGKPQYNLRGREQSLVTPKEVGLINTQVRCENCRYGGGDCQLFEMLNEQMPDTFDLDASIDPKGCCNAFTKKGG